jgi:hypothetical protein
MTDACQALEPGWVGTRMGRSHKRSVTSSRQRRSRPPRWRVLPCRELPGYVVAAESDPQQSTVRQTEKSE